MRSVELTGRQALRELRRMLGILRTDDRPSLDPQPGVADIALLVDADAGHRLAGGARGIRRPAGARAGH